MSIEACNRVKKEGSKASQKDIDDCNAYKNWRKYIYDRIKSSYLIKYLKTPDFELPGLLNPGTELEKDRVLFAEVFLEYLQQEEESIQSELSLQIKESGVHLEVVEDLLHQFYGAVNALEVERERLL